MGAATRTLLALAALLLLAGCATRRLAQAGDTYLQAGRTTFAVRSYRHACERRPDKGAFQLGLAQAYLADAQPQEAEAPARKAIELEEPGADLALAEALIRTGRTDDAAVLLEAAQARGPEEPAVMELCALLLLAHHDPAAAATMQRAVDLAPTPRRQAALAWLLTRSGATKEATVAAHAVLDAGTADPEALGDTSAALLVSGDEAGARVAAREVQSYIADISDRWREQASHALQAGDIEGALRLLARVAALHPQDGALRGQLGVMFAELGDLTQASHFLEAALATDTFRSTWEHGLAYQQGGTVATMGFQNDEAAMLGRALAQVRLTQGLIADAAQALRAALVIDGSPSAEEWAEVAAMFEKARDWPSAVAAAQEALRLEPATLEALLILTRIFRGAGDTAQAIGYGRMAWRASPGEPRVALALGELYEQRGEPAAARELYLEALRLEPTIAPLRTALRRVER